MLKPSYSATKFEVKGMLECGEIYVCDNLQDIVIQVIIKDATNDIESRINILKSIVIDYINMQAESEKKTRRFLDGIGHIDIPDESTDRMAGQYEPNYIKDMVIINNRLNDLSERIGNIEKQLKRH